MTAAMLIATLIASSHPVHAQSHAPSDQVALLCTKSGEQTSGMNKICYYNCAGSQAAITVGAAQLCPISIDR